MKPLLPQQHPRPEEKSLQAGQATLTSPRRLSSSTASQAPTLVIHPRRRFLHISWFFLRTIVHVFIFDVLGNRIWFTRWYAQRSGLRRWSRIARRFRGMAIRRGGVLIKLGQFLSARADILPEAITTELAGLQDEVPAAPLHSILPILTSELGAEPEYVFADFNPEPVAAASLGQVYYGTLKDGRRVAVKVQRPSINAIVEIDLRAVHWAVRLIKRYPAIRRRVDLELLFEEFSRVLHEELDYVQEAYNAQQFRSNFDETEGVYFPQPYPRQSTGRVLVMERVEGLKITDHAALDAANIDRAALASRINQAFLKQIFTDGFFHADPHPGNLFVRVEGSASAPNMKDAPFTLIMLDTGMVGSLSTSTMDAMRTGIIGVVANDAERIIEALEQLNVLLPSADRRQITQAISIVLRHTYDRSQHELTNLDIEQIFADTEHLVRDMPFQLPQQLIFLGRSISMVSGLVTGLHPNINLFEEVRPFANAMLERERGEQDWRNIVRRELLGYGQIATTLPRQMDSYLKSANRGELRLDTSRLERRMQRVEQATRHVTAAILSAGLFIGGILLRNSGSLQEAQWAWVSAAVLAIWALWPR